MGVYHRTDRRKQWVACLYTVKGMRWVGSFMTKAEAKAAVKSYKKNNPELFKGIKHRKKCDGILLSPETATITGCLKETTVVNCPPVKGGFIIGGTGGSSASHSSTPTRPKRIPDMEAGLYEKVPERILVLSDIHAPYHHPDALIFIKSLYDAVLPDLVVILGDEIDSNSISFYPSSPSLPNAGHELQLAREFLKELNSIFNVPVIAVESNHTSRIYKKAKSAGIPKELILPYQQLLGVDWRYAKDWIVPMVNGTDILFSHTKGINTRAAGQASGCNICVGHFHKRGGIEWWKSQRGQEFFSMSVPCLINHRSPAYSYDENSANLQNLGAAVIEQGVPTVAPMFTDKNERWTGELWRQLKS